MNILFLTISPIQRINYSGIYTDLMRKFRDEGHSVYIVSSVERRLHIKTNYKEVDGVHILSLRTLNLTKTNVIEKGVGQLLLEEQYKMAIKRYLSDTKFDIILYTTPPITLTKVLKYLKKRAPQAQTYLLLKDIFPQNAVDLGMMAKRGIKSLLYRLFRNKEKRLYELSDYIGCMSPANVKYLLKHNKDIKADRVEVAPNSYQFVPRVPISLELKERIREKYGLPLDKPIFIYGGNLGKPQGIPFLIDCLNALGKEEWAVSGTHYLIVGKGTEKNKLDAWYNKEHPKNITVLDYIPKGDYDVLIQACDVGLIFLDFRFTIPNYPSRLLPYLKEKKPIIAATDLSTDVGTIAERESYGFACHSNDVSAFVECVKRYVEHPELIEIMGEKGYRYFSENYTVDNTYNAIISHV